MKTTPSLKYLRRKVYYKRPPINDRLTSNNVSIHQAQEKPKSVPIQIHPSTLHLPHTTLEEENSRTSAQERVAAARAAEIEQRTAVRNRELIPMEEAIEAMDELVGVVRSEAASVPARITREVPLRRKIEAEVDAMLNRIADALTLRSKAIETGKSE